MQAHVQLEFEASLREAVAAADRTPGGGWVRLSCRPDPRRHNKLSFFVDGTSTGRKARAQSGDDSGRHNFMTDPWSRHVIQVEGETVPALVVLCTEGYTKHQAFLMIASARGFGRGGVPVRSRGLKTRVRSLGYVGPFLQQYGKAAKLAKGRGSRLLDAIASPGRQTGVRGPEGTFVPADVGALDTSCVPLNPAQRDAVLQLSGGLDIVVGPPGKILSTPAVCTYLVSIGALGALIRLTAQNHELPRCRLVLFSPRIFTIAHARLSNRSTGSTPGATSSLRPALPQVTVGMPVLCF